GEGAPEGAAVGGAVGGAVGVAELALLISCVGRKLVLMQRIEEEVEGVREVLGARPVFAGFYSYGEISPHTAGQACELHNQTMTITTFRET
ncbi:MAG: FIST C-terminal domain-containing protein, partial [Burkholderiaceae bacterium]|nr:FIST C-terminal domain-containing protein [Burkholderiaceae bacterium]